MRCAYSWWEKDACTSCSLITSLLSLYFDLRTLEGHDGGVLSAVFSSDEQQVLTASYDRTAKIWCAASGECLRTLEGHGDWVLSAVFSS